MLQLGDEVRDEVTGFQGIATARYSYLNGCNRVFVQPKVDKEKMTLPAGATFDEPQLVVIKAKFATGDNSTGGPEKYMPDDRPTDTRVD